MGVFDKLRRTNTVIHNLNPEFGGHRDPRIQPYSVDLPVKWEMNTRGDMNLLRRYTHGDLKYENTGKTCENCVNFYPTAGSRTGGRCRAKGFSEVGCDWPADTRFNVMVGGYYFQEWPECPLFTLKERLSRK